MSGKTDQAVEKFLYPLRDLTIRLRDGFQHGDEFSKHSHLIGGCAAVVGTRLVDGISQFGFAVLAGSAVGQDVIVGENPRLLGLIVIDHGSQSAGCDFIVTNADSGLHWPGALGAFPQKADFAYGDNVRAHIAQLLRYRSLRRQL